MPQGSVLVLLLFLIYINDLVNANQTSNMSINNDFVLFADDTNIFVIGKNENYVYLSAQKMLDGLYGYMYNNQLHINLTESAYMHFRPHFNQTCARTRIDKSLKLANYKLKRATKVKFLVVVIDDRLSWEPQIKQLKGKFLSSIVVIKRIRKFIPKDEYLKIYNALFKSHISYCISSWGGVSEYKLKTLFSVQKRCVRLLFGKEITFDHAEYYETCARVKTYKEHTKEKNSNWSIPTTKPIFNDMNLLSLHHLYIYHTFIDTLTLLKYIIPISIFELFKSSPRDFNIRLRIPRV